MKVFVSWSGELSHNVALALRDWVPVVLPFVSPWVSSEDIAKGTRWANELALELETTSCGILCLTRNNLREPWLNFEAGALSKQVEVSRIHPLLIDFGTGELKGPLSQFQATESNSADVKKLLLSINSCADSEKLANDVIERNHSACWNSFDKKLRSFASEDLPPSPINTSSDDLDDSQIKTLHILASAEGKNVFPNQLATELRIHVERAQFIMESLEAKKLLHASYNYLHGTSWGLTRDGRAELVKRGLV